MCRAATMSVAIRPAERGEAGELAGLVRLQVEYGLRPSWDARRIECLIRDPAATVLVADAHGDVAGVAVARANGVCMHLLLLGVQPHFRRLAVGSRLLSGIEDAGAAAGLTVLKLEVRNGNRGARGFYRARGFCLLGVRSLYYGREAAAVMARRLQPALPSA